MPGSWVGPVVKSSGASPASSPGNDQPLPPSTHVKSFYLCSISKRVWLTSQEETRSEMLSDSPRAPWLGSGRVHNGAGASASGPFSAWQMISSSGHGLGSWKTCILLL